MSPSPIAGDAAPQLQISPVPTDEEAAAIMAAWTVLWPQPQPAASPTSQSTSWRFADRWWHTRDGFGR